MNDASTSAVCLRSSSSDSSDLEGTAAEDNSSVVSLLDVLKASKLSELNQKRKVLSNRGGKRRKTSSASSEPKGVTPRQRVREFPGEHLTVSMGKLFCNACREEVSLKSSSVKNHIHSAKHTEGKTRLSKRDAREKDIAVALKAHNAETHLVGEKLPEAQQVFRVKVVTAFLRSAVPLSKLDNFKDLLEEGGYRLTDRHNLSDLIPFIQKKERECVLAEISGHDISVIFDGTCRLGEALCLVIRFISDSWNIEQRLVALKMLQKTLTGEEIAREVISTLSVDYHVPSTSVLASMRDRASSNNVALRTLKVLYPDLIDVSCFSHTIDHVGEKFDTLVLAEFISGWISLFAHSPKNKALWREQTGGRSIKSFSATRWWSRWEVMEQLLVLFGDVDVFLHQDEIGSPATVSKLMGILSDPSKRAYLQVVDFSYGLWQTFCHCNIRS